MVNVFVGMGTVDRVAQTRSGASVIRIVRDMGCVCARIFRASANAATVILEQIVRVQISSAPISAACMASVRLVGCVSAMRAGRVQRVKKWSIQGVCTDAVVTGFATPRLVDAFVMLGILGQIATILIEVMP